MRILLTGAQGFIGRATAAALLARGYTVAGLGRSARDDAHMTHTVGWGPRSTPSPTIERHLELLRGSGYSYLRTDLLDTPGLTAIIGRFEPEIVIHLAAALRDENPDRLVASNISTVVSLMEAAAGAGARRPKLVLGSSGSVYGPVPEGAVPISEDHPCAPGDPYSVSKRAAEDLGRILSTEYGIDAIWARIFNPMGAGQDERHLCGAFGRALAEIAAGERPPTMHVGPLDTTRDYQHVDDTAAALALLAEKGEPGRTYNVASGVETTGAEILAELQELAGVHEIELTSRTARRVDMRRHFADISAIEALGYAPQHDLGDGLAEILQHYAGPIAAEAVSPAETTTSVKGLARLTVTSRRTHSYEVSTVPGLLGRLPQILSERYPNKPLCVFTDDVVSELYGRDLVSGLSTAGVRAELITVPAGEASKCQAAADRVIAELRDRGFDRRSVLVNLGGGMITDLGGYVAATYLRGVSYVNVPTTVLAQHDSAIGGKVAVNAEWAKNFIGAFHHPCAVFNDPEALVTLPEREIAAGVSESIKVAICGAPGLFDWLCENPPSVLHKDSERLAELVHRSASHKAALLEPDPYEVDLRRVLNLGHTFGHPLETHMAPAMLHGEAVAFGIAVSTGIGISEGLLGRHEADRILSLLALHNLPPAVSRDDLLAASKGFDDVRLVRAGVLNFVVPTSTSSTVIVADIADNALMRSIEWLASNPISSTWILE